jgi:hypothetical protein|tara:strand:+ start:158 stop:313 length:156 start_codon:yes stop_codon:yes gene_type:complete
MTDTLNETTNLCIALFNAPSFTLFDYLFTAMGCAVMGWVGKMLYDTFGEGY